MLFRSAQHDPDLHQTHIDHDFLIYNRAWTGTREYRLKFAEGLVQQDLTGHCITSFSPRCDGYHYSDHRFLNPAFQLNGLELEKHFGANTSDANASADPEESGEASVLAIDDADDFAEDDLDDGDEESEAGEVFVAVPVTPRAAVAPRPLRSDALPASVYLLVDKTVELEARPLREFPELGSLPEEEQERQALMLCTNPRQAKRQCGRSQRVIKVPDSEVLQRRSSYLVAQGITRLVIEGGALYSLPGA